MQPYAQDMGDAGPPYRWVPERRELLRAELDAAIFHVYGLDPAEIEHVLDSFPVFRKYEERDHGEFRSKRLVLDIDDAMGQAAEWGTRIALCSTRRPPWSSPLRPTQTTMTALTDSPFMLLVIADREPRAWLFQEERFVVPSGAARGSQSRTRLLLHTTRGCYRNRTRDRGVVMGVATLTSDAVNLDPPVSLRGRDFPLGFAVDIQGVATPHERVEFGSLAGRLDVMPDAATRSTRLRRSRIPRSDRDAELLLGMLRPMIQPRIDVLPAYLQTCKVTSAPGGKP